MQFLKDNAAVILIVLAIIILALIVISVLLNTKLVKNLVSKRFSFHDLKEVDKDTNTQNFSIIVANRSLNDIAVNAIGVVSGLKFFDFQKNYREFRKLTEDSKPVIPQRASIKLSIGIEELEHLVFSNVEKEKLKRTCVYVIDSSGNMSKCRARNFHKILKADYCALLKAQHAAKKREEFGKTKDEIASREAQGLPVSIMERVKLVFAKFPKGGTPAAAKNENEIVENEIVETTNLESEIVENELSAPPEDIRSEESDDEAEKENEK